MQTAARARGVAAESDGRTRGRALGDSLSGRRLAAAKAPGAYPRIAARSGRVLDPPLLMPAKVMRGGAQRAILIGSSPIKNSRISLKTHAMFFSESRYSAIHPENRQCRFEGS